MTMVGIEASATQSRPGRIARWKDVAQSALPSPSMVIFGSAGWGAIMAITALAGIWIRNGLILANPFAIASVFFYGGSLAFAPAFWLATLLFHHRGKVAGVIGSGLIIAIATHLATSAIFALQYRVFYAHWHADFPSVVWFFQLGFTSAGAVFTFTVTSLQFYWPLPFLAFVGFGAWLGFRGHAEAH